MRLINATVCSTYSVEMPRTLSSSLCCFEKHHLKFSLRASCFRLVYIFISSFLFFSNDIVSISVLICLLLWYEYRCLFVLHVSFGILILWFLASLFPNKLLLISLKYDALAAFLKLGKLGRVLSTG